MNLNCNGFKSEDSKVDAKNWKLIFDWNKNDFIKKELNYNWFILNLQVQCERIEHQYSIQNRTNKKKKMNNDVKSCTNINNVSSIYGPLSHC